MTKATNDPRLRIATEDLCDVLGRLRLLHERLLEVLAAKEAALVAIEMEELETIQEQEAALLGEVIEEEKERLLVTEEIGDLLSHERPVTITVSEMLPALPDDLAAQLGERRDHLRAIATELSRQNAVNRALIEHSMGHVQVFLSKLVHEQTGGPQYTRQGAAEEDGGTFFMDRRA